MSPGLADAEDGALGFDPRARPFLQLHPCLPLGTRLARDAEAFAQFHHHEPVRPPQNDIIPRLSTLVPVSFQGGVSSRSKNLKKVLAAYFQFA